MSLAKRGIRAVGFDLDGTLYSLTDEMNNRVRNEIAQRIAAKVDVDTLEEARDYFEERYAQLHSGSAVLSEVGYDGQREMEACLAQARVADLLFEDRDLAHVLSLVDEEFVPYLLTSSPEALSKEKLAKLGISHAFAYSFYGDNGHGTKSSGEAFVHVAAYMGIAPEHHLYVGDRLHSDIMPAKIHGMTTASVGREFHEADFYLPTIYDVRDIL